MELSIIKEIEKRLLPITKENSFTGSVEKDLMIGELLISAKLILEDNNTMLRYLVNNDLLRDFELAGLKQDAISEEGE